MSVEAWIDGVDLNETYEPDDTLRPQGFVRSMQEYHELYRQSIEQPEAFWQRELAAFYFKAPYKVLRDYNYNLDRGPVSIKWFAGAVTNVAYNCLDHQISQGRGESTCFIWEGNDPAHSRTVTYNDAKREVCKMANVLKARGVAKGDRVAIYMPMIPELAFAVLACARIGAVHSVVFGGFSSEALASRIADAQSRILITADGSYRGTKLIDLKGIADRAVELGAAEWGFNVDTVIVVRHVGDGHIKGMSWAPSRDVWWHDLMANASSECEPEWMDAEDPLFMLYTSGSTGKPKGVVHTTAGYMVWAAITAKYIFNLRPGDVYWCTADIGWVTGHTYIVYGPLCNGVTSIIFEGIPTHPGPDRFWAVCAKYKVKQLYTAPTAIRALMRFGDEPVKAHDLSSLEILGTVGEPINPSAWRWYRSVVGRGRASVVDTFWQTETGGQMIAPLPFATPTKPGSATLPFFGVEPAVLDAEGRELEGACRGYLVFKSPWPGQMRTIYGDHERFQQTYFAQFRQYYVTGDGCRRDKDGYYWITGRVDDVMNVSGHRIGTAEVESAIVAHPKVAEAAVVGYPHDIKGEGIYAYVVLKPGHDCDEALKREVQQCVRDLVGAFAQPDVIQCAETGLPKTRSGKIMRRILRKIAHKQADQLGDISTLADPSVVDDLIQHGPK